VYVCWFANLPDFKLCSKYLNIDGNSVDNSYMTFAIYQISWEAKNRTWIYKKIQTASFPETSTTVYQNTLPYIPKLLNFKIFFFSFSIYFIPGSKNWFCLLQCCDRRTGRQADINPVDRDFRENTWDFSWNIFSFMFLVSISFVTQDSTTANSHFMHLPFFTTWFLFPPSCFSCPSGRYFSELFCCYPSTIFNTFPGWILSLLASLVSVGLCTCVCVCTFVGGDDGITPDI